MDKYQIVYAMVMFGAVLGMILGSLGGKESEKRAREINENRMNNGLLRHFFRNY